MPKVSVILSTYNQEKFLSASIESILEQSYPNFELLVVDDASCDKSLSVIKKFALRDKRIKFFVNQKKLGLTKSLNKIIKKAKGVYLARMDADDIALPNRLKKQVEFLDNKREFALVGSWAILIDEQGKKLKVKKPPAAYKEIYKTLLAFNPFIHSSLMFRHSVLKKVGFYDENFLYAQDYELLLRILKSRKGANIAKPLLMYRVGEKKSVSVKKLKEQEKAALKARWQALTKFGYPFWQAIYLAKPFLSFLIPAKIKLFIYKKFLWR